MADLLPLELWNMTFSHLDYKDLRRCILVDKFFQQLTHDPRLSSILLRGTVISTMTSYYKFLLSMYLEEGEVAWPSAGGWPEVTRKSYLLGESPKKTDDVIEVARHLPHATGWDDVMDHGLQIYPCLICTPADGFVPEIAILPPSAFCMGEPTGRNGYYLFVDTEQGKVTIYDTWNRFKGEVECGYKAGTKIVPSGVSLVAAVRATYHLFQETLKRALQEVEDSDERYHWRNKPNHWFPDLFGYFKWEFRELRVVPSGRRPNLGGGAEEAAIFRKHGWPSSNYDKTACMAELMVYVAENSSDVESAPEE